MFLKTCYCCLYSQNPSTNKCRLLVQVLKQFLSSENYFKVCSSYTEQGQAELNETKLSHNAVSTLNLSLWWTWSRASCAEEFQVSRQPRSRTSSDRGSGQNWLIDIPCRFLHGSPNTLRIVDGVSLQNDTADSSSLYNPNIRSCFPLFHCNSRATTGLVALITSVSSDRTTQLQSEIHIT